MKKEITLQNIVNLFAIFDNDKDGYKQIKQEQLAAVTGIGKGNLSNMLKGTRNVPAWSTLMVAFNSDELYYKGSQDKNLFVEAILDNLEEQGILYPEIQKASQKGYAELLNALRIYYADRPTKTKATFADKMKLGNKHFKNSKYAEAIALYDEAKDQLPSDNETCMEYYENLGYAAMKVGKYAKSKVAYNRAIEHCHDMLEENPVKLAVLYDGLGVLCRKARDEDADYYFDKAAQYIKQQLEIDPNDPYAARIYNHKGVFCLNVKNYDDALKYYDTARKMRKANYEEYGDAKKGFYIFEYAYSVHNIGTLYNKMVTERPEDMPPLSDEEKNELLEKASHNHEQAYNLRADLLDLGYNKNDCSREIAQTLTLWANDLTELGQLEKAKEKCTSGLKIRLDLGTNIARQDVSWSYYTLGVIYDKSGELSKAKECFENSYEIRRDVYNDSHPYAARALYQMGKINAKLGNKKIGLNQLKKAHKILVRSDMKENDPDFVAITELISELED